MRISSINNGIVFGGIFSFLRPSKKGSNSAVKDQRNLSDTARRAEDNLQRKLVSYKDLMINFHTGDILDLRTGDKCSGKFVVPADKFEHIHDVRDGMIVGNMVRLKTGQKQWACYGNHARHYKLHLPFDEAKRQTMKMIESDNEAEAQMRENFYTYGEDNL